MKRDIDIVSKLAETFFALLPKMTKEQIMYWGRNKEEFEKVLTDESATIFGDVLSSVTIPPQHNTTIDDVFRKKPFRKNNLSIAIRSVIEGIIPATPQRKTFVVPQHCYLSIGEILEYFNKFEGLENNYFTVQQVKVFAEKQRLKNTTGVLGFGMDNNFIIKDKNGKFCVLVLWWYKHKNAHRDSKLGSWDYWVATDTRPGRLFILE